MPIHKKIYFWAIISFFAAGAAWSGIYAWKNLREAGPALRPPPKDIARDFNTTGLPLELPDGFSIDIFAKDLPGARVMAFDSLGNMWVSQTKEGRISLLTVENGRVVRQDPILKGLNRPHGLAFDPQEPLDFYYAETDKISHIRVYSSGSPQKIIDLPGGGGHFTRTVGFGPDGRLYVSVGSTCNVCIESDPRRAAIYSMNKDGSDFRSYATGLRNAVFFDWSYVDGRMWATEMGRDHLGDDLPPDEINIVREGEWYGWPWFYGKNIEDRDFQSKQGVIPAFAKIPVPSHVDLQAHSAPLGLAFVPEEGWPEEYWYDLLVAYHGSWNRTEPTGYKIVRLKLDAQGNYQGAEDFITGWLTDKGALGRPVDVLIQPGGIMYVSDDHAGVIYKITYRPSVETGNEIEKHDLIRIDSPRPNTTIKSPLTITGEARGTWYFEASFPVQLLAENGNQIAVHYAQAQGEWMTANFVPFESAIRFPQQPEGSKGTLIFHKNNPSGLPEHDDSLRIPVVFGLSAPLRTNPPVSSERGGCIITGCSGQVCAGEEVITTCEYREEYACYKTAACERRSDGQCGWTITEKLRECLDSVE